MGVPLELPESVIAAMSASVIPFFLDEAETNLTNETAVCFENDTACTDAFNECFTRVDSRCVSTSN